MVSHDLRAFGVSPMIGNPLKVATFENSEEIGPGWLREEGRSATLSTGVITNLKRMVSDCVPFAESYHRE